MCEILSLSPTWTNILIRMYANEHVFWKRSKWMYIIEKLTCTSIKSFKLKIKLRLRSIAMEVQVQFEVCLQTLINIPNLFYWTMLILYNHRNGASFYIIHIVFAVTTQVPQGIIKHKTEDIFQTIYYFSQILRTTDNFWRHYW